jgi:hypothetical protein
VVSKEATEPSPITPVSQSAVRSSVTAITVGVLIRKN